MMQKKMIKEVMAEVYDKGYAQGKADAYAEMADTITFLSRATCRALEAELAEIKEKNGLV